MKALQFDVLVVGSGPAGLAAAACAAHSAARVGLVDDNPTEGGQIWRGVRPQALTRAAHTWLVRARRPNVTHLNGVRVIAPFGRGAVLAESAGASLELRYNHIILATGARERFLPFPGWTLPGVMGVGGLQALAKGGWPIVGKRVVVAGSGPLLLAVAAHLRGRGATVRIIAEQAPWTTLVAFARSLLRYPEKLREGAALGRRLRGVPFRSGCWVTRAYGNQQLEAVTLRAGTRTWTERCDYLACGFGLVPNIKLAATLGCAVVDGAASVDKWQHSSVAGVFCAGEVTGIGGVDLALAEGQIAGFAATGNIHAAQTRFRQRARAQRFAAALERGFALRDELKALADADTIVCRCEDVPYAALQGQPDWRTAKLQIRCGMGPCQGRVCGSATAFMFGWTQNSIRPPIAPARLESFAGLNTRDAHTKEIMR